MLIRDPALLSRLGGWREEVVREAAAALEMSGSYARPGV
jgi:hypothetical protein